MPHHSFTQILIITSINVTMTRSSNNSCHHAPRAQPAKPALFSWTLGLAGESGEQNVTVMGGSGLG